MTSWALIIGGLLLITLGASILLRHRKIWQYSLTKYKAPKSKSLDLLKKPSKLSYIINILIIWPTVVLVGVVFVYFGIVY